MEALAILTSPPHSEADVGQVLPTTSAAPSALHATLAKLRALEPFELGSVMALLTLATYGDSVWYARVPVIVMVFAGLVVAELRASRSYWAALATILFTSDLLNWQRVDNHKYLFAYFAMAVAVSLTTKHSRANLAHNARVLLALVFGFAMVWKLISPDFVNGMFFRHTLLLDGRFSAVTELLGGVTSAEREANAENISLLKHWGVIITALPLHGLGKVGFIADLLTVWTLIIEGAIALAMILPLKWRMAETRHALLMLFVLTTYVVAPVLGFAGILLALGAAQVNPERERARIWLPAYLLTFLIVQTYSFSWSKVAL